MATSQGVGRRGEGTGSRSREPEPSQGPAVTFVLLCRLCLQEAQVTIECAIPQKFHRSVMGPKGSRIQQITRDYSVQIKFPDREENPGGWRGAAGPVRQRCAGRYAVTGRAGCCPAGGSCGSREGTRVALPLLVSCMRVAGLTGRAHPPWQHSSRWKLWPSESTRPILSGPAPGAAPRSPCTRAHTPRGVYMAGTGMRRVHGCSPGTAHVCMSQGHHVHEVCADWAPACPPACTWPLSTHTWRT